MPIDFDADHETQVEQMAADLAAADRAAGREPPMSIQMLNEAALRFVLAGGLRPSFFADAVFAERGGDLRSVT